MSKLNITIAALTLLIFIGISISSETTTARDSESQSWGKGQGAVHVRIKEISKTDKVVEIMGMIRSKKENLQVEWKLPDGATLLEGELTGTATRSADGSYAGNVIKVDVSNAKDEPIAFMAFVEKNNERLGHSRVYKWNKTEEETEHVEKIRAKMRARKVSPVQ